MTIEFLRNAFAAHQADDCLIWLGQHFTYAWLLQRLNDAQAQLDVAQIAAGQVVTLEADYSPHAIAMLLALFERGCIVVPMIRTNLQDNEKFREIACPQVLIHIDASDQAQITPLTGDGEHPHYAQLRARNHPGLVLFSSGSTGLPKGIVQDMAHILEKFRVPRKSFRTLTFLLYDHIGGVNTLLYTLSNGGCLVTVADRSVATVCRTIAEARVELLPTSPTFLKLLLLGEGNKHYDLSSLKLITYGTEPMPAAVLKGACELFPQVEFLQTYGLSEVGILRSKSKENGSLWLKVGGEGFQTRIVDGILQIKSESAMLGYLNAPSPFTEDGWLNTQDEVEVDGEHIRILGRASEIINVGGEKVYPAEVENIILQMDGVVDVTVFGRPALTGQVVSVKVRVTDAVDRTTFAREIKAYCRTHLARFKVPAHIRIDDEAQHNDRFKKTRGKIQSETDKD